MDNYLSISGYPFNPEWSSCSTKIPNTFRWSNILDNSPCVVCDNQIKDWHRLQKDYAWLAESPELLQNEIQYIKANYKFVSFKFKGLFTCVEELVSLAPNFYYIPSGSNLPWIQEKDYNIHTKTKICSMFASFKNYTRGHQIRHSVANQLVGKIDIFGGAAGSQKIGQGIHPDKLDGLRDYAFSVVIENGMHNKYYTEKITDCFATGTIPVYWGTPKITEDFNSNGIVFLESLRDISELTMDLYNSKIEAVRDNFERVKKLEMADDVLFGKIKELS